MLVPGNQPIFMMTLREFSRKLAFVVLAAAVFAAIVNGQSSDRAFPTPILSNEISGVIPARDIGDSRLTTYYFLFEGGRGDIFINIVTANFNGEIDVFTAQGLDPKTKITIYADNPERETGRVIYQRRTERLILRIQGRTPNDDPATYRIKFAGSFAPLTGAAVATQEEMPAVAPEIEGAVRVNSVGTIIEPKPVETPLPEAVAETETKIDPLPAEELPVEPAGEEPVDPEEAASEEVAEEKAGAEDREKAAAVSERAPGKPRVIITDNLKDVGETPREVTLELTEKDEKNVSAVVTFEIVTEEEPAEEVVPKEPEGAAEKAGAPEEDDLSAADAPPKDDPEERVEPEPDPADAAGTVPASPLARVFLKVELKDGSRFEKRMTEVVSVNVIRGVLTIVTTDGEVREIDILDVVKMIIE